MKRSMWNPLGTSGVDVTVSSSIGLESESGRWQCKLPGVPLSQMSHLNSLRVCHLVHKPTAPRPWACSDSSIQQGSIGAYVNPRDFWRKTSEIEWKHTTFLRDNQVRISKHWTRDLDTGNPKIWTRESSGENIANFLELLSIAHWLRVLRHQKDMLLPVGRCEEPCLGPVVRWVLHLIQA